jgi:hypothetical protein
MVLVAFVTDETAWERYPDGWEQPPPYMRIVPAPWATAFRRAAGIGPAPGPIALRLGCAARIAVAEATLPFPE